MDQVMSPMNNLCFTQIKATNPGFHPGLRLLSNEQRMRRYRLLTIWKTMKMQERLYHHAMARKRLFAPHESGDVDFSEYG